MKNKITDEAFESIVYISHPYGGEKENENKVAGIILELRKKHPDYLFISPIHCFSYEYQISDYETGISYCLWLLEKCDEMWVFGDWKSSKGCNMEIEYCNMHGIPYEIKK